MTRDEMAALMEQVYRNEIQKLRSAGQKEYAHLEENAFANFERTALDVFGTMDERKRVLWVFAMKHKDGIAAYLKGHTSQREDVRGRINDLIVYLFLLRGMIEEDDAEGLREIRENKVYDQEIYDPEGTL